MSAARTQVVYKFVEVAPVTDAAIEEVVNDWVGRAWHLEGIHFAMREASHRPSMAFVAFVRNPVQGDEPPGESEG